MRKKLSKKQWKRRKRLHSITVIGAIGILAVTVLSILIVLFGDGLRTKWEETSFYRIGKNTVLRGNYPEDLGLDVNLLTPNEYSRPETPLERVEGVVIHYTANPDTDATANRNYFEGLKDSHAAYVSSHFIVGLDGTIVQCIPTNEVAYASNTRNVDTISIEVCHPDKSGKFNKKTYNALVELVAWICCEFKLDAEDIIRHYDVTGKNCPKYFVEQEEKWDEFKKDVFQFIKDNKK